MRAEIRCLTCGALGWCRAQDVEGNSIEANDDDLAEICDHLKDGGEYAGTGKVEYDGD
jgi:hypothetical protein